MLVKIMSNSLDIDSERNLKNKCTTDNLFKLQNQKLDEYIEFINNPYYSKSFPKYYSKSIINIINNLYISIILNESADALNFSTKYFFILKLIKSATE